jgi:hypothetical protein
VRSGSSQCRGEMGGRLPYSALARPADCGQSGRIRTALLMRSRAVCSVPRGELLCKKCKLKDAITGSSQGTLTESSLSAGGPLPDCNYIKSFRLDISRIDAPHHTTPRLELRLIASGLTALTFVFLIRHRSHACFTRFVDLSIMARGIKRSTQLAYVYNPVCATH